MLTCSKPNMAHTLHWNWSCGGQFALLRCYFKGSKDCHHERVLSSHADTDGQDLYVLYLMLLLQEGGQSRLPAVALTEIALGALHLISADPHVGLAESSFATQQMSLQADSRSSTLLFVEYSLQRGTLAVLSEAEAGAESEGALLRSSVAITKVIFELLSREDSVGHV